MDLDDTVCYCFHVSKRKIVNYIRIHEPKVASQISECDREACAAGHRRPTSPCASWAMPAATEPDRSAPATESARPVSPRRTPSRSIVP